ncbi:hypothetical protein ACJIZ3_017301 [Penstemon smallii]|uniref:Coiled-coil SMC6 And NSE5 INteracting (CANIN) domain-containing protein n=1 Tax=Penstemon smallii TaxID=265156 RepID=A0ABD3SV52_9LAMI
MADTYEPLDFEFEEPVKISSPFAKKKKKLIGLDDLLEDHVREQEIKEKKFKRRKIRNVSDSEDEVDDAAEAQLSECVDKCQTEINKINGDDEMPFWGIEVFGDQRTFPQQEYPELKSSVLLQSFVNNKINSLVELNTEKGEDFFEGLLADGWLLQLIYTCGCVEKSIATWTFNLMLYSSKLGLMEAACEFWCNILSLKDKQEDSSSFKIDWLPRYSDLKRALEIYGFLLDLPSSISSDIDMVPADCDTTGPPQNIRCWIKYAAVCCKRRSIFSTEEAEDLLVIIISLLLDRKLLGLSMLLSECMVSAINFFRDEEWHDSCEKVAKSLAFRLPRNINCLRLVESITGVDARSKQLRSAVAFRFLVTCLDVKVCDAEEVLRWLSSINVKDKSCDLFKMYLYLSLAENWLSFDSVSKDKAVVRELWGGCLRNCSCGITITDLRSYASNVRTKASYLLQGNTSK